MIVCLDESKEPLALQVDKSSEQDDGDCNGYDGANTAGTKTGANERGYEYAGDAGD